MTRVNKPQAITINGSNFTSVTTSSCGLLVTPIKKRTEKQREMILCGDYKMLI